VDLQSSHDRWAPTSPTAATTAGSVVPQFG
jgi:hypothetical protein